MEILLPTGTRKIDYVATVEHIETIFPQLGLQYPTDVLLDQNYRD
jgi:hypothetical protein